MRLGHRHRIVVLCAVTLSTLGCDEIGSRSGSINDPSVRDIQRATQPIEARPIAVTTVRNWDASKCGDDSYQNAAMERHPTLMGRSPAMLQQAFGAPTSRDTFVLGKAVGTYRGGRAAGLPGGIAANGRRTALEFVWTRRGCNFTVRFIADGGNWRAFEAFESLVGADF